MQKQRVTLFVRISEQLKNQITLKAEREDRSVARQVEHMLTKSFEEENGKNSEPKRALRETTR